MVYESCIDFTFDTICPWTYLAKRRLHTALSSFTSPSNNNTSTNTINFTLHYTPYLLYPSASSSGTDKRTWYTETKYHQSPSQMAKYETVMKSLGEPEGIAFDFGGEIAGTFDAHRVIQYFQRTQGSEVAGKVLDELYRMYFEQGQHPSSEETLMAACRAAGVEEVEGRKVVEDKEVGREEVEEMVQEVRGNGVDSVPVVTIEGRRRDVTLEGCREIGEYLKALEQVAKECT